MTAPVRLTSLTLRNFKAIGDEPQTLSFAPITLLFGPNSAGKSTIIHALHYAREILCNRNLDPHQIQGDALDLGGFRSLIHNHELDRTVQLGFECHIFPSEYGRPSWLSVRVADEFETIFNGMLVFSLEIDLRFSELRGHVYVSRFSTTINSEPVGTIEASADGRRIDLTNLNIRHPLLFDPEAECWLECGKDEIEDAIGEWFGWLEPPSEPTLEHGKHDDPQPAATDGRVLKPIDMSALHADALPRLDAPLPITDDIGFARTENIFGVACLVISIGMVWPAELLSRALKETPHVGPIREIPPRNFAGRPTVGHARWIDGLAAWDILAHADTEFIDRVNGWLAAEGRLNSGYAVRLAQYRELPLDSPLIPMLERGELLDDADLIRAEILALPVRTRVYLRREGSMIDLLPSDVGVGLSQLIPIIVVALHTEGALVAVEQPELHNHPSVQVALGDLFIEVALSKETKAATEPPASEPKETNNHHKAKAKDTSNEIVKALITQLREAKKVTFLIETHSEHLILRMLRRIRETAASELPPGAPALKPDDIAVYYVEPALNGARVKHLRVNNEGDFIDRWPRGFFEERVDELF